MLVAGRLAARPALGLVLAAGLAMLLAIAMAVSVPVTLAGTAVVLAGVTIVTLGRRMPAVGLGVLAVLLAGYAWFGRGLAHVGAPPLYIGELALVLMAIAALWSVTRGRVGVFHAVLVAFIVWGALQTIPYLSRYGLDAFRDAVTWGYAAFALSVSIMLTRERLLRAIRLVGRLVSPFVIWVPISAAIAITIGDRFPAGPGSEVPLVYFKGGDMGVHLAAAGAFVLLDLPRRVGRPRMPLPLFWTLWLAAVIVVGVITRGGMFAAFVAFAAVLFAPSVQRFGRPILIGLIALVMLAIVNPTVDIGGVRRLSLGQVIDNVTSVLSDRRDSDTAAQLQGTKSFRLKWWRTIVGYTVDGPYFWTGKGFGINLADADGFQVTADHALRSPHNGHVEVLARMGVPGLVLWVLLQAGWGIAVFRRARADTVRDPVVSRIAALLWVWWAAMLVNATFDPYLQGPQGGIWFWAVFGAGLFILGMKPRSAEAEPAAPQRRTQVAPRALGAPA